MADTDWLRDKRSLISSTINRCPYFVKLVNDVRFILSSWSHTVSYRWQGTSIYLEDYMQIITQSLIRTSETTKNGGTVRL